MTQTLSTSRRIVRAIHGGIAGVFFVLMPVAMAGDEVLRDAIFHGNWNELRYMAYWFALGLAFLIVALSVRRANIFFLTVFALLDLAMLVLSWNGDKDVILVPILAVSVLALVAEMFRMVSMGKRQVV